MTEQIKSIRLDGNNNVVIQSVQNSQIKVERIDWDSFVQKYTIEQRERIQELQKLLSRSEELFGLKEQKYAEQIGKLQQDIQRKETQLKDIIQQYKDKDIQATTSLYQRAFAYFIEGELNKALEVLDDAQLDEAEQQQADARILKANILQLENRFDEAEKQLKRAVAIYPSVENLFLIAHFYQFLNAFEETEYYYYECLKENITDYEQATVLNNLAILYRNQNNLTKSEQFYLKALVIYQQLAKSNPQAYLPYLATNLNNLGFLHYIKNDFIEAEQVYEKALKIRRQLAKVDSKANLSHLAMTLNNLANLFNIKNDFIKAEKNYQEALKIRRQLATTNPEKYLSDLAATLNDLSNLYKSDNKFVEAEEAIQEALKIRQQLVEVNPQTYLPYLAATLNNLANLYQVKKEFCEAEHIYRKTLQIYRHLAQLNPQSYLPDLTMIFVNLSFFYIESIIDKEKSVAFANKVIQISTRFQHIPVVMQYRNSAIQVLQEWGINVEDLFQKGDNSFQDEQDFKRFANEQFLKGYAESDAIHDDI